MIRTSAKKIYYKVKREKDFEALKRKGEALQMFCPVVPDAIVIVYIEAFF